MNYMPIDDYYKIIGRADVAIFGQLRQEAAGNIAFLLANGTKVFLRENNVLYEHYKKLGFMVFSFERDLNSINDLVGLSTEEKIHNLRINDETDVCYEDYMPALLSD